MPTYSICASAIKFEETVFDALMSCGLTIPLNLMYSDPSVSLSFFCPFISKFPLGYTFTTVADIKPVNEFDWEAEPEPAKGTNKFPLIPTEDEGRLNDSRIRENFIVKVFSFYRLQNLFKENFSIGRLVKFHTQQKYLLLAHSRKHYDALGQLVAKPKSLKTEDLKDRYGKTFMEALNFKATPKKNTDVLLHMMGFLKKILSKGEKSDILSTIEDYRKELLPLIVPITLIYHQVNKYNIEYLKDQVYLKPHPKELMLRNHV